MLRGDLTILVPWLTLPGPKRAVGGGTKAALRQDMRTPLRGSISLCALLFAACGQTAGSPLSFGDAAAEPHPVGAKDSGTRAPTGTPDALPAPAPCVNQPPMSLYDSGAPATGVVSLSQFPSAGNVIANLSTFPYEPPSCIGPPVNTGGCCIGDEVTVNIQQLPTAGTISITDNGASFATLPVQDGLYPALAIPAWTAGDTFAVAAPGGSFPMFALDVMAPGPVPKLTSPIGNQVVSTGSDLTVEWTPAADATAFVFTISQQISNSFSACALPNGQFSVLHPYFIYCVAPNSPGSLTVPAHIFSQARFVPGEPAGVSYASQNLATQSLPAPDGGMDALYVMARWVAGTIDVQIAE